MASTRAMPQLQGRAASMARSLAVAVRGAGLSDFEVAAVERIFALAMEPRIAMLDDDHHPAYLHPGRSVLILLQDVGCIDVGTLVVAAIHESVDGLLRIPDDRLEHDMGEGEFVALGTIPIPGEERLLEKLVTLKTGTALAALAERLDHLRHLHLRDDLRDSWRGAHQEVLETWLPFSHRIHPRLATRFEYWTRRFAKRI